ncbi:carbohydrate esterase family 3 protein [Rutstroemia sp. NJR-2017a WRK4]|nr:carbohydrate esterase family 3 protein [Rutstroemia sp. NJR-2017a WRK4]
MSVQRFSRLCACVCLFLLSFATGTPSRVSRQLNGTAGGKILRIQPLGNSITFGYLSSDGNGYRLGLQDLLLADGNTVQYVGSVQAGNITDNFNEGHPGAVITQIAQYARLSLPELPNVVLLMAGTNDMNGLVNITGAPARLGDLLDEINAAVPGVTTVVAQLTPAANATVEKAIEDFNAEIPNVVSSKVAAGQKVSVVNMMDYVTVNDLKDGLHPTDHGYQQMAQAWFKGIQQVQSNGWVSEPATTNATNKTNPTNAVTLAMQTSSPTASSMPVTKTTISSASRSGVGMGGMAAVLTLLGSFLLYT